MSTPPGHLLNRIKEQRLDLNTFVAYTILALEQFWKANPQGTRAETHPMFKKEAVAARVAARDAEGIPRVFPVVEIV